jgi:SAM-dependent methyltransferase
MRGFSEARGLDHDGAVFEFARRIFGPSVMKRSLNARLLPKLRGIASSLGPDHRVLDVGAKQAPYRQYFSGCRFETVDVRPEVKPDFVADVHKLASVVPVDSFDLVICTEVLEHVENPRQAVEEIRRILKPNGTLLATTPFIVPYHPDPTDYWRMTPEAWRSVLRDWSFAEVSAHGNRPLAVWYLLETGWGSPLKLLNPIIHFACKWIKPNRIFLGLFVEARR